MKPAVQMLYLESNRSETDEISCMENEVVNNSAEKVAADADDIEEEEPELKQSASSTNVLSAYLNEIRKWKILTKDQEQLYAKTYSTAQEQKNRFLQKWAETFAAILDWNKANQLLKRQCAITGDEKRNQAIHDFLSAIRAVRDLRARIRNIDKTISLRSVSHYNKKKLRRERAGLIIAVHETTQGVNLLKLYRSGIIKELYPYVKAAYPKRLRHGMIATLRGFLEQHQQGRTSKEQLLRSNLRLVVGIAKKYIHRGLPLSDLIQEGNIGLIRAIEKFDYRLGNRISTYASWWIRQTIIRSIEDRSSTIRVPVYINEKIKKLAKDAYNRRVDPSGLPDKPEERQASDDLLMMLQLTKEPISLETPFGEDGSNLHECISTTMPPSPMDQVLQYQLTDETEAILKDLSPREERILRMRFGLGVESEYTLQEIGDELGVSRERIRQLEVTALRKIKASKRLEQLLPYLYN